MTFHFVSDLARRYGCKPRAISDLLYDRHIDDGACPVIAGRRCIPDEVLPKIEAALRERGLLKHEVAGA